MECNKDEAFRAKSIAEDKLEKKDFIGARKFASKAKNLYPGIDGLEQMLTTIEVYISAENKISSGEADWYGVLGLNPSVDEEAIKKQYRKLALMLHPDKNKSAGANGVFLLIKEAFGILSDKAKRLGYDQRRASRAFQQKAPMQAGGPSGPRPSAPPPSTGNGTFSCSSKTTSTTPKAQNKSTKSPPQAKAAPNCSTKTTSNTPKSHNQSMPPPPPAKPAPNCSSKTTSKTPKSPNKSVHPPATPAPNCSSKTTSKPPKSHNKSVPPSAKPAPTPEPTPSVQKSSTFWTICQRCNRQYEYFKIFLDRTILCNHCKVPFLALAITPPNTSSKSSNQAPKQRQQSSSCHVPSQTQGRTMPAAQKSAATQVGPSSTRNANAQQGPIPSKIDPSVGGKTAHTVHQAHCNSKRAYRTVKTKSGSNGESVKKRK